MKQEIPWFIRKFRCKYVMLIRDFETITGVKLIPEYTALQRPINQRLIGGLDYNGYGWRPYINLEEFKKEHGFEFGEDDALDYLYLNSIEKALCLCGNKVSNKIYFDIMTGVIAAKQKEIQDNTKPSNSWWSSGSKKPSLKNLLRDYETAIMQKESLIKECAFYEGLINEFMAAVKEDKEYTKQTLAGRLVESDAI